MLHTWRSLPVLVALLVLPLLALALLLAPAAAGGDDLKTALREAKKAVKLGDLTALKDALEKVIRVGGKQPMKELLSQAARIPVSEDRLYWGLLSGVGSFVDQPALEELGKYIAARKRLPIARDLLYALSRNRSPNVAYALGPVLDKGPEDLQIQAAVRLGNIRFPQSVDVLIEALKREEKRFKRNEPTILALEIVASLTSITGEEYGPNSVNWEGWWKKNRETPLTGVSKRERVTGTAVDYLDRRRQKEYFGLEKAPKKGVVVLSAEFTEKVQKDLNNDHMEEIVERMEVPHEVVRRENFMDFNLKDTGAILVNCGQFHKFCICPDCKPGGDVNNRLRRCTGCDRHEIWSGALTGPQIEKLRNFVMRGGFLFCEDWVVKELLEKAFPRYVAAGKKMRGNTSVDVVPVRGKASHTYLRGIFVPDLVAGGEDDLDFDNEEDNRGRTIVAPEKPEDAELIEITHRWAIDDESFALKVLNSGRIVKLLTSGELHRRADGDATVALAFRPGTGRLSQVPPGHRAVRWGTPGVVMMVLSHFGKQQSRLDEHTLENLLLNFLIDANVARERRAAAKKKR